MIITTTGETTPQTDSAQTSQDSLLFGGPADITPRFGMLGMQYLMSWYNYSPGLSRAITFIGGIGGIAMPAHYF